MMQYRRFGRTELQISVFSCGGMRYQHKWQDLPLDEVPADNQANLEATVRRALELGINHIETARGYGSSERQLGQILPALPRDEMIVQTKVTPRADPREFLDDFHDSLGRLGLDHVDLFAIHGVNSHDLLWWTIRPGGCLDAARKLREAGKIRHIGLSTHGPPEVVLPAVEHEGGRAFDYVNLHWFFIQQDHWPTIRAAREADMGVFIISPSDKGGMLYQPSEKLVSLCEPLHPQVFNYLFSLARPEINTLSVGAARPSDFDRALETLELLERAEELLGPIEARLRQAMVEAVGVDVADRFAEGLPPWYKSPGYMAVATMLWLRNLALAYDMIEYGKMRYNLLGNGGHWFPGLNAAHVDDHAEELPGCLKNSPFKEQIAGWLRETHEMLVDTPLMRLADTD